MTVVLKPFITKMTSLYPFVITKTMQMIYALIFQM